MFVLRMHSNGDLAFVTCILDTNLARKDIFCTISMSNVHLCKTLILNFYVLLFCHEDFALCCAFIYTYHIFLET